ncbi:MAG: GTP-binding protein [Candidatus Lokiarchaeota archaeon]|nr:GTP-binding protein [Candidatus Lokiarchaeota archaeon]
MSDIILKICLLGEAKVGKTTLVYRYIENKFRTDFRSTLGVNLLKKTVKIGDSTIVTQIWDLGGQEPFKKLRKLYLEGAEGALLLFDVTNQQSFIKLEEWILSFREVHGNKPVVLIGNKIDLKENIIIDQSQAERYASENNMSLVLTSAKTGENVEKAFVDLLKRII